MTGSDRRPDWEEYLTVEGSPLSQERCEKVLLLAEGTRTLSVAWHKHVDRLALVPKNTVTFARVLNPYVAQCSAQAGADAVGFQLEVFSQLAPRIWEMLGRGVAERASIEEILCYYEAILQPAHARSIVL